MRGNDWSGSGQQRASRIDSLDSIADMLGVERFRLEGWDETSARLFANDCASIVYRQHLPDLTESAQDLLYRLLNQARRLVIADRDGELEVIERALIAGLEGSTVVNRAVWLVALNSILPDPVRAATTSTEAALLAFGCGPNPRREAVIESLTRRLVSRAEEASLLGGVRLREFRIAVA
jgi:hypothetical protein